jgi:DNA polymerase-3 subunit epsilon
LLSRRLYLDAPNCRLGTLAQFHQLPDSGRAHRALADAMTTAHLLLRIQADVSSRFAEELAGLMVGHELLMRLQKANKSALKRCVQDFAKRQS